MTGHIYTHEYEEKNGLRWHVRRFRFVPSACYATAAMGICTRKNEKNKMAVSFVCNNVCVDDDEDDFDDEITRDVQQTDRQTDIHTDRHTYRQSIKFCRSWETNALQIGLLIVFCIRLHASLNDGFQNTESYGFVAQLQ